MTIPGFNAKLSLYKIDDVYRSENSAHNLITVIYPVQRVRFGCDQKCISQCKADCKMMRDSGLSSFECVQMCYYDCCTYGPVM